MSKRPIYLLVLILAATLLLPSAARADAKSVKVSIMLRGAIGEKSVAAMAEALKGVKGIKFDAKDITKGEKFRFFTPPFKVEITDPKNVDVGALAKAIEKAKTPVAEELKPGMNLVLYSQDQVSERSIVKMRDALAGVAGVDTQGRGKVGGSVTDAYVWVKLDGSGKAKLKTILDKLFAAGIKVTAEQP